MEEKDWVGMDCCPICGEPRGILINQRMSKTLNKFMTTSLDLCNKCLKDAKENGWFVLYETTEEFIKGKLKRVPTGRYMKLDFNSLSTETPGYEHIKKIRVCLTDKENFNSISKRIKDASRNDSENASVAS